MKRGWLWSSLLVTSTLCAATGTAHAAPEEKTELCPESERERTPPECSAVHLLSNPGYRVLPRARIRLGVAPTKVAFVIRLALF
jgi:hypothetical protein